MGLTGFRRCIEFYQKTNFLNFLNTLNFLNYSRGVFNSFQSRSFNAVRPF